MNMANFIGMLRDIVARTGMVEDYILDLVTEVAEVQQTDEVSALIIVAKGFQLIGYDNSSKARQKHLSLQSGIPLKSIKLMWKDMHDQFSGLIDGDGVYALLSRELRQPIIKGVKTW